METVAQAGPADDLERAVLRLGREERSDHQPGYIGARDQAAADGRASFADHDIMCRRVVGQATRTNKCARSLSRL